MNSTSLPATIPQYLQQLRDALAGSDPALVQDALYDAEEYLRSEWAEKPALTEAAMLASVAGSYGAPAEVADIYRDTEATVTQALRAPPPREHSSLIGRFFGVVADPRAYTSLLYMLLSIVTGVFYSTWTVTGLGLSVGFAILIIGIPFLVVFLASVRGLSLVEGRLVEGMLGERMPRRPLYSDRSLPIGERIKQMFTDPRTWSTLFYTLLMLPLGTLYFSVAVIALSVSFAVAAVPLLQYYGGTFYWLDQAIEVPLWATSVTVLLGVLMLVTTLHLARGIGSLHAQLAKAMLTKSSA